MATLPFVVQPRLKPVIERVGSEESGVLEIERRGYLTTGEKSFVQQVQQMDSGANEVITVSRQVARRFSLGMDRAYTLVLSIISGAADGEGPDAELVDKIEQEFAEQLTGVVRGLAVTQSREELVFAACLLRYRVDPNFQVGDISTVHPDIITDLAALYRQEEAKSLEGMLPEGEGEGPKVSVEEAEKKPEKTTGSRSKRTTGD